MCAHDSMSFPITDKVTKRTTVTCFDCGRKRFYDWQKMRTVGPWFLDAVLVKGVQQTSKTSIFREALARIFPSAAGAR